MDSNIITQFTEPENDNRKSEPYRIYILLAGIVIFIGLLVLYILYKPNGKSDFDYLLAGLVALIGGISYYIQQIRPLPGRHITITAEAIVFGENSVDLTELAGFWLELDEDNIVVNIARNKRTIIPLTFKYPGDKPEIVKQIMLNVLPEIEPPLGF